MSEEIITFAKKVISQKNKSITDEVFLLIQNNRDFMQKYLQLVKENGSHSVNTQIGKLVKKEYNLENDDGRNEEPKSTLIASHQEFV
jgi:hypothetical protein